MAQKTTATNIAPITRNNGLMATFAARFNVDADKMATTLKLTCFKTGKNDAEVTNEQLMALIVVAQQYGLNPFTKELYAFPDQKGGIVPVVSIDGWIRIINERPELQAIEFTDADIEGDNIPAWIECAITRKDRSVPIRLREYFAECKRSTGPWQSHPRRMLRHKALIQAARVAFGFAGIYDPDEAERIAAAIDVTPANAKPKTEAPRARADAQPAIDSTASDVAADEPTGEVLPEEEAGARG